MKFSNYKLFALAALCSIAFTACNPKAAPADDTQPTPAVTAATPAPADSLGATPEADMDPAAMADDQQQTTAALMKVAQTLASTRGNDGVAVIQFCDQNASAFANQNEVAKCKALGRKGLALPSTAPRSLNEALQTAATLPMQERFIYCTSTAVLKLLKNNDDYNKCFPPSSQAELAAKGGLDALDVETEPVTAAELKEQVLLNASRMNERERKAYCNVGNVIETLNGNNSECLAGLSPKNPPAKPLTDDDPGYRDAGH